jgi:hypothetical protein
MVHFSPKNSTEVATNAIDPTVRNFTSSALRTNTDNRRVGIRSATIRVRNT